MTEQKWIKIKEKLPEQQQICLVSIMHQSSQENYKHVLDREVALAVYIPPYQTNGAFIFLTHSNSKDMDNVIFNNGQVVESDGTISSKITAWMPLPEPDTDE